MPSFQETWTFGQITRLLEWFISRPSVRELGYWRNTCPELWVDMLSRLWTLQQQKVLHMSGKGNSYHGVHIPLVPASPSEGSQGAWRQPGTPAHSECTVAGNRHRQSKIPFHKNNTGPPSSSKINCVHGFRLYLFQEINPPGTQTTFFNPLSKLKVDPSSHQKYICF